MPNPGLYPREQVRPTESVAEKKLYTALGKHLPKGWYAWHSLRIKDQLGIDGEGDFVLAARKKHESHLAGDEGSV